MNSSLVRIPALYDTSRSNVTPFVKPQTPHKKTAEAEFARIRMSLAMNPNTAAPVLDLLANGQSVALLERVAEHPRTAPFTLMRLATHLNAQVRVAVAENANISPNVAQLLSKDPSPDVRMQLAENYFVPVEFLKLLSTDENPYVQGRALATLCRLKNELRARVPE